MALGNISDWTPFLFSICVVTPFQFSPGSVSRCLGLQWYSGTGNALFGVVLILNSIRQAV